MSKGSSPRSNRRGAIRRAEACLLSSDVWRPRGDTAACVGLTTTTRTDLFVLVPFVLVPSVLSQDGCHVAACS
jgi:hypothetical protein